MKKYIFFIEDEMPEETNERQAFQVLGVARGRDPEEAFKMLIEVKGEAVDSLYDDIYWHELSEETGSLGDGKDLLSLSSVSEHLVL